MATNPPTGVVGEGAVLKGTVKGRNLDVQGVLEGDLQLQGRLQVGPGGRVSARVRAQEVWVEGEIDGEVNAASLTLTETARARGTFVAKRLVVKEGALVEGSVNPATASSEPPVAEPPPVETKGGTNPTGDAKAAPGEKPAPDTPGGPPPSPPEGGAKG